ncbi:surfeit locus 1 family protein [Faunimonas pinastri]|uniref:SURF1-like protein n=1 Tax=Faunimonas pinastri TaxID=1855383 RepID=A0A1H8ZNB6_9HYPH|nr:SURF1 family protein [Faunimonas pinastri]SEP65930.1 surfeit locus 1 family protein [Faunimonas pinastri]
MTLRLRGLVLPAILTLLVAGVLVGLGNWQLRRLAWKEGLIAAANERPHMAVAVLPAPAEWPGLSVDPLTYRPFRMTGHFLFDREVPVFTSLPDPKGHFGGPGYWVVTPFALSGGGTVLVNRGFVPQEKRDASQRSEEPAGEVTVTGLLRPDDSHGFFTPAHKPGEMFFTREIAPIAEAQKLTGPTAPFTIDLVASETPASGLPQAGETRMLFANSHLQYALTWYGLAIGLIAVFVGFVARQVRNRGDAA